jgi:hypothetical protein
MIETGRGGPVKKSAIWCAIGLVVGAPVCTGNQEHRPSIAQRVRQAVDATTHSKRSEAKAFRELLDLGPEAVPYLVGYLIDDRLLASPEISLPNEDSNSFEGYRHYGPKVVHDALAAILNHLTYKSFVWVYNGSTPQERADNRQHWVAWCKETYPSQSAVCEGVARGSN